MNGNQYTAPSGIAAAVTASLVVVSNADPSKSKTIAVTTNPQSGLQFGNTSLSVGSSSGSATFQLSAYPPSTAWTLSSNAPWLTVTPLSGVGTTTVNYSYTANSGGVRTATLTANAAGMAAATLDVTQAAGTASLVVSPQSGTYASHNQGGYILHVSSTSPWTATANQGWIAVSTPSGPAGATQSLYFSLTQNLGATRAGTISVISAGITKTVSITQNSPQTLSVYPSNAAVTIGTTLQFTAYIDGYPANSSVVWTAGQGTISNGLYTPPSISASNFPTTTVTATIPGGASFTANITLQNVINNPASVVSYSSSSQGSGPGGTFGLRVRNPNGVANFQGFYMRFTDGFTGPNIQGNEWDQCSPTFERTNGAWSYRFIYGNASGTAAAPLPIATNPQTSTCRAYGPGIEVTQHSGTDVTGSVPLTFIAPSGSSFMTGPLNIWANAVAANGYVYMETSLGTYAVTAGGPDVLNTNQNGSGSSVVLSSSFTHAQGASGLKEVEILVSTTSVFDPFAATRFAGRCNLQYRRASGTLYLRSDDGSGWTGGIPLGSAAIAENSQCRITGQGATMTPTGQGFSLAVPVEFKRSFAGAYALYGLAVDNAGLNSSYKQFGYWTATFATVAMSPLNPSATVNGTIAFSASVSNAAPGVTWSVSPAIGTIHPSTGVYTAPGTILARQTTTVSATSVADPVAMASTTLTLIPVGVEVTANTTTVFAGAQVTLSAVVTGLASQAVNWSAVPATGSGTFASPSGLSNIFTAASSIGTAQTVTLVATSAVDGTKNASVQIAILPEPPALGYFPITPCRAADTRAGQGFSGAFGPPGLAANTVRNLPMGLSPCLASATGVEAYSLNFTVVPPVPLSYLSVWPGPASQPRPTVSTLNSPGGLVIANGGLIGAGVDASKSINLFAGDATNLIVDVNGYFGTQPGALSYYPLAPCRAVDTRAGQGKTGAFGPPSLGASVMRDFPLLSSGCGIPAAAQAYVLNVTAVPNGALSYLSVWKGGQPYPGVSTLNSQDGSLIANTAIVAAGADGSARMLAGNASDVIVDVSGYFAPPAAGGLRYHALPPCRVADTRAGQGKSGAFGPEFGVLCSAGHSDPKLLVRSAGDRPGLRFQCHGGTWGTVELPVGMASRAGVPVCIDAELAEWTDDRESVDRAGGNERVGNGDGWRCDGRSAGYHGVLCPVRDVVIRRI